MGERNIDALQEIHVDIQRTYRVCVLEDGRTVWGESLAEELIEEALRLLCAVHRQDVDGAFERLVDLAHQNAHLLKLERQAGQKPGLVVKVDTGG